MKYDSKHVNSFVYGIKFLFWLPLLLLPPLLILSTSFLPYKVLKKTPVYERPLTVTHTWVAYDIQKVSEDKEGRAIYEIGYKDGRKSMIKKNARESLYAFEEPTYPIIILKTNRQRKREEEKEIKKILFAAYFDKNVVLSARMPEGYKRDLVIKLGGLNRAGHIINGILFFFIVSFSLSLYFPIIERIVKLFKECESSSVVEQ